MWLDVPIPAPDMQVDTIHSTNRSGELIVTEYLDCSNVYVRFLTTGYTTTTDASSIRKGQVKDHLVAFIPEDIRVGTVHSTNRSGPLIVTAYLGCKNVCVRFLDTGYTTTTSSDTIRLGRVRDSSIPVLRPQKKKAISFI
tara:strand:- start:9 stop:428 length:420 start_codon:yes stop_codon:yes gene_type:complete